MEEEEDDDAESDETIDYNDLFVDESSWSWLSAEQKLCAILVRSLYLDTLMAHL